MDLEVPRSIRGGGTNKIKYLAPLTTVPSFPEIEIGKHMGSKSGPMIGRGGAQDASSPVAAFVAAVSSRQPGSANFGAPTFAELASIHREGTLKAQPRPDG